MTSQANYKVVMLTLDSVQIIKTNMFNENNEQSADSNSNFIVNHDLSEQLEILFLEQPIATDYLFKETEHESDDYFMELEFDFDE